ncbi:hypothetical protein B0H13DRAFT_1896996 [Mycena leptocephala]|nr:hypothetical protein B0H13DRAFT_1896996 [Mycena leptocephala]
MGFFDFIGDAVNVVKGLVHSDSPLIQGLGSVASMVAHAIPGVGPVIDVAVPVLDAIFSDSSSPSPIADPLSQPLTINLRRTEQQINEVLDSVKKMESTLQRSIKSAVGEISNKIDDAVGEIAGRINTLMDYHQHMYYHNLHTSVKARINARSRSSSTYFSEKRATFKGLTASSGPIPFDQILTGGDDTLTGQRFLLHETVFKIQESLNDDVFYPSQDMLDLYIMGVQWLLMFDKAIIITTGLQARAYNARMQYFDYLKATRRLRETMANLHNDAKSAREALIKLIKRLERGCETRVGYGHNVLDPATNLNEVYIKDLWPEVSIGWIPRGDMEKVFKEPLRESFPGDADPAKHKENEKAALAKMETRQLLFEQIMQKKMDFCLRPARAVVEHLEDSIRQWNSRLPVSPAPLPENAQHVVAELKIRPGGSDPDYVLDPRYIGKHLLYTITYSNSFGESPETNLTPSIEVTKNADHVELKLHPVKFENDPTDGISPVKDGNQKPLKQNRGIRRKIYVQYYIQDTDTTVMQLLGEVGETEDTFQHKLLLRKSTDEMRGDNAIINLVLVNSAARHPVLSKGHLGDCLKTSYLKLSGRTSKFPDSGTVTKLAYATAQHPDAGDVVLMSRQTRTIAPFKGPIHQGRSKGDLQAISGTLGLPICDENGKEYTRDRLAENIKSTLSVDSIHWKDDPRFAELYKLKPKAEKKTGAKKSSAHKVAEDAAEGSKPAKALTGFSLHDKDRVPSNKEEIILDGAEEGNDGGSGNEEEGISKNGTVIVKFDHPQIKDTVSKPGSEKCPDPKKNPS